MLLGKTTINIIKVLISKALFDSSYNNKILKLLWNKTYKYGWYRQKNIWKNGIETIVDNDRILWLNEKHIEKGLDHTNLQEITLKCYSKHIKHRHEPDNKSRKQCNMH